MKKYLCLIGVLGVLLCNTANSYAQKVAVKTNLLYDATTTMNLGLEIGLGKKWSLDLSGNYNPRFIVRSEEHTSELQSR